MKDVGMFETLKNYFTREYMRLSEKKENLLSQKICLETEEKNQKDLFYDRKIAEERKRLFSPFDDILFELVRKEREEVSENSEKIQELENNVNQIEYEISEIKEYIQFLQSCQKKEITEYEVTDDLKESLELVISFLQSQYEEVEFLIDFEQDDIYTSVTFNENVLRMLTYTISSTIEMISVDSVILEVKEMEDKIRITLYMLLEDEVMDDYTYDFNFKTR